MRKSKIVSYSSEEVKQLPDESDWEGNAAMTDEEIEAAIASDPDEATLSRDWMKRGIVMRKRARFVMCIDNGEYLARLTRRRVYKVILAKMEEQGGWLRIVDDTGEDNLFPANRFVPVQIPQEAEQNFEIIAA